MNLKFTNTINFLILFSSLSFTSCLDEKDTSLELIQIIFRHGDRTPIRSYPNDPFNETIWSKYGGYGQLTDTGIKRAYEFGSFLRKKYSTFLGEFYNKNEVLVRSTDYDRTLMTVSSLLAGLYPPKEYQLWNNEIRWRPIPIHTNEIKFDDLFYMKDCPLIKELYEQVKLTDEFKEYVVENSGFIKSLNNEIGSNSNLTIEDMEHIADGIFIQKENNLTIPTWSINSYEKILHLGSYIYNFYYLTTQQARLATGAILNQYRLNIQNKVNNQSSQNKLYLYSSHDTYIAGMIKLLNLSSNVIQPPYVSAVVLELRKSLKNESKYYVQCFLKNNTIYEETNYRIIRIGSCSDDLCPLDEFISITNNLTINDFQAECKSNKSIGKEFKYSFFLLASLIFTFTFAILFSFISILNYVNFKKRIFKKRNQSEQYEAVNLMIGDFNDDDVDILEVSRKNFSQTN